MKKSKMRLEHFPAKCEAVRRRKCDKSKESRACPDSNGTGHALEHFPGKCEAVRHRKCDKSKESRACPNSNGTGHALGMRCLAITAVATCLAAWTPFGSDTVTLGAAMPLTGSLANTGRTYRDAYQFTVDKINEKGGMTV